MLLQVRTQVINDEWEDTFRCWYPGFRRVCLPYRITGSGVIPPGF